MGKKGGDIIRRKSVSASGCPASAGSSSVTAGIGTVAAAKEGNALHVVPVQMGQQDRAPERFVAEQLGQSPEARTGVEQQGGTAAVPARRRDSATQEVWPPNRTNSEPGAGVDPRVPQKVTRTRSVSREVFTAVARRKLLECERSISSASNRATRHGGHRDIARRADAHPRGGPARRGARPGRTRRAARRHARRGRCRRGSGGPPSRSRPARRGLSRLESARSGVCRRPA